MHEQEMMRDLCLLQQEASEHWQQDCHRTP
jgi:hypothetical protein